MKKIVFILAVFLAVLIWPQTILAQAFPHENIKEMRVDVYIQQDASIVVKETIEYDFANEQKHGIYRDIPLSYTDFGLSYKMYIEDVSVVDELGKNYQFSMSGGNGKKIKIGDPDRTISGLHTYVIGYTVVGAMTFEEDYDELYWNAIGDKWQVGIHASQINVYYPVSLDKAEHDTECYFGALGSNNNCQWRTDIEIDDRVAGVSFVTGQLTAGSGVTILTKLPKGLVVEPTTSEKVGNTIKQNIVLLLPVLVFIIMFIYWHKRGRDPKGRGTIIAQYDAPKDMMPAEIGAVVDEKIHHRDISAEIIYLAIQGYIKITRTKKKGTFSSADYLLEKLKDSNDLPREYQKELIDNLFSTAASKDKLAKLENIELHPDAMTRVFLSDFKDKAYKWMKRVEDDMYQSTVDKGYFPKSPKKVKAVYGAILTVTVIILFAIGENLASLFFGSFGPATFLALFLSIIIVVIFGMQMSHRTKEGVLAKEHILGLKEYIDVAEKHRIDFHNAPEKNPQLFEKLLPYAMALGIEKKWAKQFEGIYNEEPGWYHNANAGVYFSVSAFGDSLHGFQANSSSTLSSRPSSGGSGGFSGGGGGGGGGGSW
ncbi:DUF2207 domain-containing protein [Candidatus Parcubacteria bacterium]|jgi:uncharacterized membrane protein|nr:DUF2207 domain-containing protein [Candidatus Parcubacteria bacterium]